MPYDMRDLLLEATASVTETMQQLKQALDEPLKADALRMKWAQIPDEIKEMMKEASEKDYQRLMRIITGE